MGSGWAKLGLAIGGFIIAGPLGFLAGSFLGGMLFKEDYKSEFIFPHLLPEAGSYFLPSWGRRAFQDNSAYG